jgi:hypothetical protein
VTTVNSTGEPITTYPFLENRQNWTDIMLVQQLLVDQPIAATFGQSGHAWKTCAQALSRARDPESLLVYGAAGASNKSIKKRFEDLMMFVKKEENLVPFRSGSNNDPGAGEQGELASAFKDLYEIYSSVVSDCEAAGVSVVAKKMADDMANAELLRNASLGMLTENEKTMMQQGKKRTSANGGAESITSTTSSSCGTPSEASSAKRFRPPSDVQHFVDLSSERMEGHPSEGGEC